MLTLLALFVLFTFAAWTADTHITLATACLHGAGMTGAAFLFVAVWSL